MLTRLAIAALAAWFVGATVRNVRQRRRDRAQFRRRLLEVTR